MNLRPQALAAALLAAPLASTPALTPISTLTSTPAAAPPSAVQPAPQAFTLPNGLRVVLFEDHSLPLVRGALRVELPPPGRDSEAWLRPLGLRMLALGGSGNRDAAAFARAADAIGLELAPSMGPLDATWTFAIRSQDQGAALDLLADRVVLPAFDPLALEPARVAAWREVAESEALPRARVRFDRSLAALPLPGERQLATVNPLDLDAWHRARFRPEAARLVLWGDLDAAQARQAAILAFGAWTAAPAPTPGTAEAAEAGPFLAALPGEGCTVQLGLVEDGTDAALRRFLRPWVVSHLRAGGIGLPEGGLMGEDLPSGRTQTEEGPLILSAGGPLGTPAEALRARLAAALDALPAAFGAADLADLGARAAARRALAGLHPGDQILAALAPAETPSDLAAARAVLARWLGPANRRLFASGDPGALAGLQAPVGQEAQAPASTPKR